MAFGFGAAKDAKVPSKPKCPALNATQIQQLKAVAHMTCCDLVYASQLSPNCKHGVQWTPMDTDDKCLQFYTGRQTNPMCSHDMRFMCCVTKIKAELDEVIEVLNGSNGATFSADIKAHLEADVVGKSTLKTLKNMDRLKMRLKWMVLKSASPYVPMRDYVYLEYQNDIRVMGRRGWACNMHSVALPNFPSFEISHNIIRGSFYRTGYVVTETHTPGVLRVVHMMQVDFKGSGVPYQTAEMMMSMRVGNISYLSDFFRKLAIMDRIIPLSPRQRTSQREAKQCSQCVKKFNLLTKKHTCRLCGEVICSSCSLTKEFDLNVPELKDIRVCAICNVEDNEELMRSILTEVLMRPSSDVERKQEPPRKPAKIVPPRDSDILGESPAEHYLHVVNAENKRSPQPSMHAGASVILEDVEEADIEPLPLPRIPHLEKKKQLAASGPSSGPSLTKNWLGQEIGTSVESRSSALQAPRGQVPGMDWLDPLDSFRSSVASSQSLSNSFVSLSSSTRESEDRIHHL